MSARSLNRREILSRIGWGAAALPLLNARANAASEPSYPRRLVLFNVASCGPREFFWPTGTETAFTLASMTTALEELKSKLLFVPNLATLSGLNQSAYKIHEGNLHMLNAGRIAVHGDGNYTSDASIDSLVAAGVPAVKARPFPQLVVGFNAGGWGFSHSVPKGGGTAPEISREESPGRLFDQLFMNRTLPGGTVDPSLARIREERKSVLDYLGKRITNYGSRLGTEDRQRIDFHLDAVRAMEKGLTASAGDMGGRCVDNKKPPGGDWKNMANVPTLVQQQLDVVAGALSCDMTRVVSLQWGGDGGNNWNYPWLGPEFSMNPPKDKDPQGSGLMSQHYLQHEAHKDASGNQVRMRAKMEGWWVNQFAYLAKKLNSIPEGGGTMLDNTALVFIGAQGHPASHGVWGHPLIIAGSCGGFFKTGRLVNVSTRTDFNEPESKGASRTGMVAHTRLLTSLVNAMGLDVPTVGASGFGGPISELRA